MSASAILFGTWFAGPALFAALYVSDAVCTVAAARLYKRGANQHVVFEGSYELTPYHQKNVDALRTFTPRFFVALVAMEALLIVLSTVSHQHPGLEPIYAVGLGSPILTECAIHVRHARNIFFFRSVLEGGVAGQIRYDRMHVLRASAMDILAFAAIYLLLFVALGEWFFLGGALGCVVLGLKHRAMARKHQRQRSLATPGGAT